MKNLLCIFWIRSRNNQNIKTTYNNYTENSKDVHIPAISLVKRNHNSAYLGSYTWTALSRRILLRFVCMEWVILFLRLAFRQMTNFHLLKEQGLGVQNHNQLT